MLIAPLLERASAVERDATGGKVSTGTTWVATVSVQKYPKLPPKLELQYCDDDAKAFIERIREGTGIVGDQICEIRQSALSHRQPTRANIIRELPSFLGQAAPQDMVLLHMSMHGMQMKNPDGSSGPKTFLMPSDSDPEKLKDTVIPIEWLRDQLHASKARTIVLFIDACHSGGIHISPQTEPIVPLHSKSIEAVFQSQPVEDREKRIYVLASCREGQSSMESSLMKHGIFSYWLNCGLDGAADSNEDAIITMDELFHFVELHVPKSASYLSLLAKESSKRSGQNVATEAQQNPVRYLFGKDHGDIPIVKLPMKPVHAAMQRLAQMVDVLLCNHLYHGEASDASRIAIVEFGMQGVEGETELRGSLGAFGAVSRDLLNKYLNDRSSTSEPHRQPVYRIAAGRSFQRKLKGIGITAIEEGDVPDECFLVDGTRLDVLLLGKFLRRGGTESDPGPDRLQLEITLLDTVRKVNIARIQTCIVINQELWSMLDRSRDKRTASKLPPTTNHTMSAPSVAISNSSDNRKETIEQWNQEAEGVHPQVDGQKATFGVAVYQNLPGSSPKLTPWSKNDTEDPNVLAFETNEGNELAIHLENRTDEALAFIVQIDGLNQLGRSVSLPYQSAYWHMPPRGKAIIDQWLDSPEKHQASKGTRYLPGTKLLVVSPPNSLAGKMELSAGLGEIRLLVYGTKKKPRDSRAASNTTNSIGIGEGSKKDNEFPVIDDRVIQLDDNRAVYVIRYLAKDN